MHILDNFQISFFGDFQKILFEPETIEILKPILGEKFLPAAAKCKIINEEKGVIATEYRLKMLEINGENSIFLLPDRINWDYDGISRRLTVNEIIELISKNAKLLAQIINDMQLSGNRLALNGKFYVSCDDKAYFNDFFKPNNFFPSPTTGTYKISQEKLELIRIGAKEENINCIAIIEVRPSSSPAFMFELNTALNNTARRFSSSDLITFIGEIIPIFSEMTSTFIQGDGNE